MEKIFLLYHDPVKNISHRDFFVLFSYLQETKYNQERMKSFGISKEAYYYSLGKLKKQGLLEGGNNKTVLNHLKQNVETKNDTSQGNTPNVQKRTIQKGFVNNMSEEQIQSEKDFEIFWNAYPRSENKRLAKSKFLERRKEKGMNYIIEALEFAKKYTFSAEIQYIPHASTFLNNIPTPEDREKHLKKIKEFSVKSDKAKNIPTVEELKNIGFSGEMLYKVYYTVPWFNIIGYNTRADFIEGIKDLYRLLTETERPVYIQKGYQTERLPLVGVKIKEKYQNHEFRAIYYIRGLSDFFQSFEDFYFCNYSYNEKEGEKVEKQYFSFEYEKI